MDDDEVGFEYYLPFQLGFGVAWTSPSFDLEFNVLYYGAVDKYDLFEGVNVFVQQQTHEAGIQGELSTGPTTYEAEPVINFALGSTYKISDAASMHYGAFTDYSPDAEGAGAFDQIDLFGLTLGASFFQKNTSTTFGFVYTFGENPNAEFADPLTAETDRRWLRIQSLSLVAAGSVFF